MNKNCNIIKDLLPLYAENMLSQESEELVKNHLEECKDCRAELDSIKSNITVSTPSDKTEKVKAFMLAMKKYKKLIVTIVYGWLLFATMVITGFDTLDLFLNIALMIPFGIAGYILFRKSAFYKVPLVISGYCLIYFLLARILTLYGKPLATIASFLFYILLFVIPALLGIAAAAFVHSIFKKRTKRVILKRVSSVIMALICVAASLYFFFALIGNPFTAISSFVNAIDYIDERFEGSNYFPYKIRHDCVFEGTYIVYVKSISDEDINFQIKYNYKGNFQSCDYDKKYKSDKQSLLSSKYARLVDNTLNKSDFSYKIVKTNSYYTFPYNPSKTDTWANAITMTKFDVKEEYDLSTLGKTNGIILIEVYSEKTDIDEAKKVYLELRKVLDELGVGFKMLRVNLINPETDYKKSFTSITYDNITKQKINYEIEELRKYQEIK